jgi:PAS domain S-box-containing protein
MPRLTKKLSVEKNYTNSPFYIKYGVPVLLLALVTLFKLWLATLIGVKIAFMLYFGVVIISSRYFGARAGIWTLFLALLASNYFFLPPYNSFHLNKIGLIETLLFVLECSLIVSLSSALNRAINKVQHADRLFKAMIEKSTEAIIMVNANGLTFYCTSAIMDILGYTPDEFLSFEPWALMHPEETLDIKEEFYLLGGHAGKTITLQHRMKHKNGNWIWIESKTTNLLDEPAVNAVISNFSNVTDRVLLEKQREDFVAIASHELKTPVTSLKAYTQVLKSRFKDKADSTSYNIAQKIDQQVNRITRMITALLDVTTMQTGKLNLSKTEFDFNAQVLEICDLVQHTATDHKIIARLVDIKPVLADKDRIGQVITNFLTNAIKYSPNTDQITVVSTINSKHLTLSVTDKGIGIPDIERSKVFDRFYRVDASGNNFQGLGLGLYVCSQIITLHHGKIGVDSEEGKGSTFWFSLPI